MQSWSGSKAVLLRAQLSRCMQTDTVTVLHVICHCQQKGKASETGLCWFVADTSVQVI